MWDDDAQDFVKLLSTQPSYTAGLSRWEHDEYRRMAKIRGERFDNEGQRVRSRVRSLEQIDREAPSAAFRRRNKMFALAQCEEVRQRSGSRARRPGFLELPEHFVIIQTSTGMRGDPGIPPPGPKRGGETKAAKAAKAPRRDAHRGVSPDRKVFENHHRHHDNGNGNGNGNGKDGNDGGRDWDALGDVAPDDDDNREEY